MLARAFSPGIGRNDGAPASGHGRPSFWERPSLALPDPSLAAGLSK